MKLAFSCQMQYVSALSFVFVDVRINRSISYVQRVFFCDNRVLRRDRLITGPGAGLVKSVCHTAGLSPGPQRF